MAAAWGVARGRGMHGQEGLGWSRSRGERLCVWERESVRV